jgi:hypothetical protein
MEIRSVDRSDSCIAEHKLRVVQLQSAAAELARKGEAARARREREKLLQLIHKLDVMEALRERGSAA